MRLHRLTVTAFGPFAGTEEVDFEALSAAGLFLVHGPTGAGKSSVLDAVCFALYGRVPGSRPTARGALHSDHAAPGAVPCADLEVTLRGRRLRVTRSPAWERPKQRGTGTTGAHETVLVRELAGGRWTTLTTRLDEAGDLLTGLLGMTPDQFCQVVLLPQGEFASFLRSGAEDRRRVLERLFAAEVYAQVERWLEDRRQQAHREAAGLAAAAEETVSRLAEAAAAAPPDGLGWSPAWARELLGQHTAVRDSAAALRARAAGELGAARLAAEEAGRTAARRVRHADALRRARALDGRAAERAALVVRLERAGHADRVVPLVRSAAERARRHEAAAETAARTRSAVADLVPVRAPDDVLAKAERERRDEAAGLARLRGDAARLLDLTVRLRRGAGEIEDGEAREAGLAAALAELPARVAGRRAELDALRLRAAARDGAVAALEDAALRLSAARRRDALTAELADAEDAHRTAVDRAQEAREVFQELRARRLEGMAAALAAELRPGTACAVCGSPDHPAPASAAGAVPGEAEERRAEQHAETRREEREAAAGRVARLRAEVDAARERAGDRAATALALEHTAAEAELDAVDRDTAAEPALTAALDRAESDLATTRERHADLTRRLAAAHEARSAAHAEATRLATLLTEAAHTGPAHTRAAHGAGAGTHAANAQDTDTHYADGRDADAQDTDTGNADERDTDAHSADGRNADGWGADGRSADGWGAEGGAWVVDAGEVARAVEERVRRLEAEAELLGRAVEAAREAAAAGSELAAAREEADAAAAAQGFASPAEAVGAALGEAERRAAQATARELDAEESAVRDLLADPELTAAAAGPEPDVAAAEARLTAAEELHTRVCGHHDRAVARCDRAAELAAELDRRVEAWRPAAGRHTAAARLAAIATGDPVYNTARTRLSAYVLASRLVQVVRAANARLHRMSGGRYALRHSAGRGAGDGGRRHGTGGLGLRVVDGWTGRDRDPASLSGGESFITSLALALGLADVVTHEAGGAEIGTLFVDEGFGTLDEDTLDEVMDVLDGLRDGGRAVGVVSHVAELRARIPATLRVSKDRAGSHVTVSA